MNYKLNQGKKINIELVKAHNNGFMQGFCICLITLGIDNVMPTMARDIAIGHGIGSMSWFMGHGIDEMDLEKLRRILIKQKPNKRMEI